MVQSLMRLQWGCWLGQGIPFPHGSLTWLLMLAVMRGLGSSLREPLHRAAWVSSDMAASFLQSEWSKREQKKAAVSFRTSFSEVTFSQYAVGSLFIVGGDYQRTWIPKAESGRGVGLLGAGYHIFLINNFRRIEGIQKTFINKNWN